MSVSVTNSVRVSVEAIYVPDQSAPDQNHYFFAYRVTITNEGDEPVRLMSRHWIITDGKGHVEEVRGPGVVGQRPIIAPGESFEYTSACPLHTPVGTMQGTYQMVSDDGERFDAEVAPFTLAHPNALN